MGFVRKPAKRPWLKLFACGHTHKSRKITRINQISTRAFQKALKAPRALTTTIQEQR